MPSKVKYEVSDTNYEEHTETLTKARKLAKARAKRNYRIHPDNQAGYRFVLIYQFSIPGNPHSKTVLVEKWKVNAYGKLVNKEV